MCGNMRKEDTVKLISAEGFEFVIHKDAAMVSQTIRNMLTSTGIWFLSLIVLLLIIFAIIWLKISITVLGYRILGFNFRCFWILGSFAEQQHGEVTFPEISTTILEKICKYFYWNLQFARFLSLILQICGLKTKRVVYSYLWYWSSKEVVGTLLSFWR